MIDDAGAADLARHARAEGLEVVTVGESSDADLRIHDLTLDGSTSTCRVSRAGADLGEVRLQIPGRHYVLDALAALTEVEREALLRPPDCLLADWPALCLPEDEAGRFLTGLRRRVAAPDAPRIRVYGPDQKSLLGSAHITAGELIADRLLSPLEVASLLGATRSS